MDLLLRIALTLRVGVLKGKKMFQIRLQGIVLVLAAVTSAASGQVPPRYTVTDLGTLGGSSSTATAINSSGEIVGYSLISGDVAMHAFLYANGSMQDLGTLGGPNSGAYGINNSGQIVGASDTDSAGDEHAFLYSNGSMQELPILGGSCGGFSFANSINNVGQIVGTSSRGCSYVPYHGFLYTVATSTMTDLGVISGRDSIARAITDAGVIAGESDADNASATHVALWVNGALTDTGAYGGAMGMNSSNQIVGWGSVPPIATEQAFLYSNGTDTGLGTLGGTAFGMGINDSGIVVGLSCGNDCPVAPVDYGNPAAHAFLYNGTLYDLTTLLTGSPGWTMYNAYAIDDQGRIVGTGTFNGQQHAVLLTPVATNPPVAHPTQSPAPYGAGWNNTNVIVQWNWTDAGGPGIDPANCTASSTSSGQGAITLTATCKGLSGLTGTAQYTVKVDLTPPTVTCSAMPSVLWPANNKLVSVTTTVNVSDSVSGPAGFSLVSVTSSEPDSGSGDIQGWTPGSPSTSGQLRAARLGSGTGRVYTLTYRGSDIAGNAATCQTTVSVPHDQGK